MAVNDVFSKLIKIYRKSVIKELKLFLNADFILLSRPRLETIKVFEESANWMTMTSKLPQEENPFENLFWLSHLTRKIASHFQKDFKSVQVEFDFFGRVITHDMIEYLIEFVCKNPHRYEEALKIVENFNLVQSKDSFTQNTLNQIVAIASVPWMNGAMKPYDLRISETLVFNLIKVSDVVPRSKKSLSILSSLMKEVAPKWRLYVLRKAIEESEIDVTSVLESMPFFLHFLGTSSHPTIKKVLTEEEFSNSMLRILAQNSGSMFCAFSKKTKIQRKVVDGDLIEVLTCQVCDVDDESRKQCNEAMDMDPQLSTLFKEVFQKLIGHEDQAVQKYVIQSLLKPMSKHKVIDSSIASLWLLCLDHSDNEVSMVFSKYINHLVCHEDILLERLGESKERAFNDQDYLYQEILIRSLKNICQCKTKVSREFRQGLLEIILDLLMDQRTHVTTFMIQEDIRGLIENFSVETTVKMAEKMCEAKNYKMILYYVQSLYKKLTMERFLKRQLPTLLATILCNVRQTDVKSILEYVAQQTKTKVKTMLYDNFNFIYPSVVTQVKNSDEYRTIVDFIENTMGSVTVSEMVTAHRQTIITELLVKYHAKRKRVFTAFQHLARNDAEFKCDKENINVADLVRYLKPRFHGLLDFFDRQLKNEWLASKSKVEMLESLCDIVKMMGSDNVSCVKHKILATLNTSINVPDVPFKVLINNWDAFITTMEVKSLNPILGQVIANLLQLYNLPKSDKNSVMKLFRYMIVENRDVLKEAFSNLYFIPEDVDTPELIELNDIIRKENGISSNTEFKTILRLYSNSMANENNDVRRFTLEKLATILEVNQVQVQALVASNEMTDPIISEVIQQLLNCARCNDEKVAVLAGACLGQIGAVDPGRLSLVENLQRGTHTITHLSVKSEGFVLHLIDILVKAYLRTSDSVGDSCSYSLQEILKTFKISDTAKISTTGGKVWSKLTDSAKELLRPLLVSKYVKKEVEVHFEVPIYKSGNGRNYSDWISNWR